jgi:hypothetical protein
MDYKTLIVLYLYIKYIFILNNRLRGFLNTKAILLSDNSFQLATLKAQTQSFSGELFILLKHKTT